MKKGFTLIELITVVIIIAILAALALPQYTRFIERSQGSTAKNALAILRKAEANYFAINSAYVDCTSASCVDLATETPEVLKIIQGTSDWSYAITNSSGGSAFSAVAKRLKGVYGAAAGNQGNITLDNNGGIVYYNGTSTATTKAEELWK